MTNDHAVSTASHSRWLYARQIRVSPLYLAIVASLFVAALTFFLLWAWAVYKLRVEFQVLRHEYTAHLTDREGKDQAWRAEFDNIYRTLYSPPEPTRRPSAVELWQINRDKELRDRIRALEQWRQRESSR
jgi:hypothetical protein